MLDADKFDSSIPVDAGAYLAAVPYDVARRELYAPGDLFAGFDPADPATRAATLDARVAAHVARTGRIDVPRLEDLARTMHDYHVRRAMYRFLEWFEPRRVVGLMGGHGLRRDDPYYRLAAETAKAMTEKNVLMISGGGPGAMEATHLGAWLAGRPCADLEAALAHLSAAPTPRAARWLASAFEVKARFPQEKGFQSLAIPTWHFSDEPPTPFATAIAKLFDNAVREDLLLTEAYGGLVVLPGGPGTLQEIFQEAVQDHYGTLPHPSPVVFVGRDFWTKDVPVYALVEKLKADGFYRNLDVSLVDTAAEILAALGD